MAVHRPTNDPIQIVRNVRDTAAAVACGFTIAVAGGAPPLARRKIPARVIPHAAAVASINEAKLARPQVVIP